MRKIHGLILLLVLISLVQCGKGPEFSEFPPVLVWEKGQNGITVNSGTRNIWSGFSIEKNNFQARNKRGMFIIWRALAEERDLMIEYASQGEPVKLFFNKKEVDRLPPTNKWVILRTRVKPNKGFNFIEFRKMKKMAFKVKSIFFDQREPTSEYDLPRGQAFASYFESGQGRISVKGKGELLIRQVEFVNGEKKVNEKTIASGFLSGAKTHDFRFGNPGFLKCSCLSGHFQVTGFQFQAKDEMKEKESHFTFSEKPDIFIFLIDGCQAAHLKTYGYSRDTSPTADALANDGVVFDNAYANATFTRSSVATIFTGYFPQRHKLRILTNKLPKNLFLMAEFFKIMKYKTSLFTEAANIAEYFGFSQGMDRYSCFSWMRDHPNFIPGGMLKAFSDWIKQPSPHFSYVHFRAPHLPLLPPPPFLDMYKSKKRMEPDRRLIYRLRKLKEQGHQFTPEEIQDVTDDYDSTIRFVDAEVGKYIDYLKKRGLYDSSLIIFTSDHGEALYEHGFFGHGRNVYNETSRIPLIVKFPANMNLKGRVERVVQLADIFPTFSRMFGQKGKFDGRSLLDSINSPDMDDTFAFSTTFTDRPAYALRWRDWYYIINTVDNKEELFHLKGDSLKNVSSIHPDMTLFFKSKMLAWLINYDNLERESLHIDLKKLPRDIRHNLKSLGYID
jgi:choline-sulfatase